MTTTAKPIWEDKRTDESRMVEATLANHFEKVDAYRYNSASIRIRVIDSRFETISRERRYRRVEKYIAQLPRDIQSDIVALFCFAPSELTMTPENHREFMQNTEFDNPSPSEL